MKKTILSLIFATSLLIALFIVGCTKDTGKLPVAAVAVSACDTITYTKHIKPLFDNYCLSCHGNPPNAGAPIYTSYADVKAASAKIKSYAVDGVPEIMPQGGPPLAQAQKDLITCWISNGMKQ